MRTQSVHGCSLGLHAQGGGEIVEHNHLFIIAELDTVALGGRELFGFEVFDAGG